MDIKKAGNVTLDAVRQSEEIKQLLDDFNMTDSKGFSLSLSGTNLVDKSQDDYYLKLKKHMPETNSSLGIGGTYDFEPIVINGVRIEPSLETNSKFGKDISAQANFSMISENKNFEMNISTAIDQNGRTFSSVYGSYRY